MAARFPDEQTSGQAYFARQETVLRAPTTLSVYRLQFNQLYHVAVVGQPPPTDIDVSLRQILAAGEPAELPEELLAALCARGIAMRRFGPRSEWHYRPGWRV